VWEYGNYMQKSNDNRVASIIIERVDIKRLGVLDRICIGPIARSYGAEDGEQVDAADNLGQEDNRARRRLLLPSWSIHRVEGAREAVHAVVRARRSEWRKPVNEGEVEWLPRRRVNEQIRSRELQRQREDGSDLCNAKTLECLVSTSTRLPRRSYPHKGRVKPSGDRSASLRSDMNGVHNAGFSAKAVENLEFGLLVNRYAGGEDKEMGVAVHCLT